MIDKRSESGNTLTLPKDFCSTREEQLYENRFSKRSRARSLDDPFSHKMNLSKGKGQNPRRSRFQTAMAKAVKARTRHLGRRLTSDEFHDLVRAVRKQVRIVNPDPLARQLRIIARTLTKFERMIPKTSSDFENSISLARMQVDMLRRDVLSLIDERSGVSETCAHVLGRSKVSFNLRGTTTVANSPIPVTLPGGCTSTVLACKHCASDREDAFFSWTGEQLPVLPSSFYANLDKLDVKRIKALEIRPLALQSIWSSILDFQFSRQR